MEARHTALSLEILKPARRMAAANNLLYLPHYLEVLLIQTFPTIEGKYHKACLL